MLEDVTRLDHPIDVMVLIHKAFHALSLRVEELAAESQEGGDLKEFEGAFGFWVKQLLFHAKTEDRYMTAPLEDSQPARDNEAEHDELREKGTELVEFIGKGDAAGLEEHVKAAMLALEEQEHQELLEKAKDVEEILKKEMGEQKVVARTRRHLYRRVMGLRVLEFDHFENEEAFVCSIVRDRMSEKEQLDIVRRLLIDDTADDPRWIIDWVAEELEPRERKLLADLEARFAPLTSAAD
ncbi:MAG: hemerythrin domain-containing protein [Chloroflexi bacterium]|nr:hemerythrin domain-containing protein [Chloroflexota bacterium]